MKKSRFELFDALKNLFNYRNNNQYFHSQIVYEIAKINIRRLLPISLLIIALTLIVFFMKLFEYEYNFYTFVFFVLLILILIISVFIILFEHKIQNSDMKLSTLQLIYRTYWFLLILLIAALYLIDAYTTEKMASLFAFYILLATIPILSFWEIFSLLVLPNVLTGFLLYFRIITLRETIFTILIYFLVSVFLSVFFYNTFYEHVRTKQRLLDLNQKLEIISITDPLTGVLNRLGFDQSFRKLWTLPIKPKTLSIISIDIDFFKPYNDTFGHQKGDECLMLIALALNLVFRQHSICIARTGGEEFAVLLSDMSDEELLVLTNNLRNEVALLEIEAGNKSVSEKLTLSFGIASHEFSKISSWNELYERSDHALYQAKNAGRNKVVMYKEII